MKGKARQANIELLRVIAMMMVIILHYIVKGGADISLVENTKVINLLLWALKALCIVSVNLYVLISGYFLLETKWKLERLLQLWLQTMFYSIGVPLICFLFNAGEVRDWGRYDWLNVLLPIQMEHYWFITAYAVLYLFIPVLSLGVKQMTKKQHELVIFGLLFLFSVPKSFLPVLISTDRYGYDFGWFLCLFLIAAYIRRYEIPFFHTKRKSFTLYFAVTAAIWLISIAGGLLSRRGLSLEYMMDMLYCYNHLLVLVAAIALFYGFCYVRIPQGYFSQMICKISSYTLGVYLLHENLAIRTKWQYWAGIDKVREGFGIFPHMLITVVGVFLLGVIIDFVRECIFNFAVRKWKKIVRRKSIN